MTDIYLTENRRQAIVVRSLQLIDKYCRLLTSDSTQEPLEGKEMDAVQCILEYCHNELCICPFFFAQFPKHQPPKTNKENALCRTKIAKSIPTAVIT